jgi:protein-disulfide isomerase
VNFDAESAGRDAEADAESRAAAAAKAAAAKAAEAKIVWKVPVGTSPVRGSPNALVTIVVFSDYQCPFCKRFEPTLDQLRKSYGDKLRIVWKDQPLAFHANAEPAAHLARAARTQKGDAGFWAMHDALFDAQPALEESDLERLSKKNGLDVKNAMAQVEAKAHKRAIEQDRALAAGLGANGTPTSFVNGRKLTGAQPLEAFKAIVDEELARAEALVKGGVPRKAVYDAAIKDGKSAAPKADGERKPDDPSQPRIR